MKKIYATLLILAPLALSIPALLALLRPGLTFGHSALINLSRLVELDALLHEGEVFPRWFGDFLYGYGYPLFNYYPPLGYYLAELFHFCGLDYVNSLKALDIFGFIASALSMFLFTRTLWGLWGGLVCSMLYIYAPYRLLDVYVRASMGESLALSLFPFILWSALKWYETSRLSFLILSTLSYAALIITHNISAMIFTPLLLIFLVICIIKRPSLRGFASILFIMAFGLGLSAFYWMPALWEKGFVYIDDLKQGYFNYSNHFLQLPQLFSRSWSFGNSYPGMQESMSFQIGLAHAILWPFSCYILVRAYQLKDRFPFACLGLFQLVTLLGVFFTLEVSDFIWKRMSLLEFLQFPWRFLLLICFSTSILGGSLFYLHMKLNPEKRNLNLTFGAIGLLCLFLTLWSSWGYRDAKQIVFDKSLLTREGIRKSGVTSTALFEYLPKWVKKLPEKPPQHLLANPNQSMEGHITKVANSNIRMNVIVKEKGDAVLNIFWFPGWQIYIDGESVPTWPSRENGLVSCEIEKGEHLLELRFEDTPLRRMANVISILSLVSLWPIGKIELRNLKS